MTYGKTPLNKSFAHKIDNMINSKRKRYADYHKTIFHIHTPESHDYKLYEKNTVNEYKALTNGDMMDIAIREGLFTIEQLTFHGLTELLKKYKEFNSVKDFLAFLLMAKKLSDENIRLAVITDHNTILGYRKLVKAISIYNNQYPNNIYTEIILGIEISCADKCHVVGIFNDETDTIDNLHNWILENIMDPESGTYKTSLDVLNDIEALNGIGYIAHVNTSDIFKPSFLSGGYKKHLFNSISHKILGVSRLDAIPTVQRNLKNYTKEEYKFVLDEDSHSLDTLASECFWMKGQKVNFSMLKNAIKDFDISIEYTEPDVPNVFIKGIVVDEGGFLSGKNGKGDFNLLFSESLNCLIGGRGTGKSTILNTINFVLSQNVNDENTLRNICKQGRVCVVCSYNNEDYYILFQTPVIDENDSVLRYFNNDHDNYKFGKRFKFDKDNIKEVALNNYIQIFKKTLNEDEPYIEEITRNKKKLLSHFFYKRYSVNELVRTSSTDEITSFILEMLFKNDVVSTRMRVGNITTLEGLKRKYKEIPLILNERKDSVHAIINEFNNMHTNKLRINYNQNTLREYNFNWIDILKLKGMGLEAYFEKFNVKNADLIDYLSVLCERKDPIKIFLLFYEGSFNEIQNLVNLTKYTSPLSSKQIETGIQEITQKNICDVFEIIRERILQNGLSDAIELIKNYLLYFDEFDLEFNINNMESSKNIGKVFKSVKELSLGQKVVAMLSFVLSYSDYSNDYTPLIIDQPEDNLDNRYIYKNLVADLRIAKSKRQVIIATHNSTIVTNSKAEQVIVLSSNNKNGWIESTGYPTEKSILTNIVNILEGGVDSFKHKQFLYESILNRGNK